VRGESRLLRSGPRSQGMTNNKPDSLVFDQLIDLPFRKRIAVNRARLSGLPVAVRFHQEADHQPHKLRRSIGDVLSAETGLSNHQLCDCIHCGSALGRRRRQEVLRLFCS